MTETQLLSPSQRHPGVRRLSSVTARLDEISIGSPTIVPPRHLRTFSDAHKAVAGLELVKNRLRSLSAGIPIQSVPSAPPKTFVTDKYAFAFDIDGVLVRGGEAIPQAITAIKILNGENEYGVKV